MRMEKNNFSKTDIYILFLQNSLLISEVAKKNLSRKDELICTYASDVRVGQNKTYILKKMTCAFGK